MTGGEKVMADGSRKEFLTVIIGKQMFGIPILQVQDIVKAQKVTHVPLARREIAGSLNLRGRIVTAIDMRIKLGMAEGAGAKSMYVVVNYENELYSLIVDGVGEVLSLPDSDFESTPATVQDGWKSMSLGIYRLQERLLIILDVPGVLRSLMTRNNDAA